MIRDYTESEGTLAKYATKKIFYEFFIPSFHFIKYFSIKKEKHLKGKGCLLYDMKKRFN